MLQSPQQIFARSVAVAYHDDQAALSALSAKTSQLQAEQDIPEPPRRMDSIKPRVQQLGFENRELKRKLNFVDEFEQQKAHKARKCSSASGEQVYQQEVNASNGVHLRKIRFADENDKPLYVTHRYEWPSDGE